MGPPKKAAEREKIYVGIKGRLMRPGLSLYESQRRMLVDKQERGRREKERGWRREKGEGSWLAKNENSHGLSHCLTLSHSR